MKVRMIATKKKKVYEHEFDTISEAYNFYLKNYSTLDEWYYYLRVGHRLLHTITDEKIMKIIFDNVFSGYIYVEK